MFVLSRSKMDRSDSLTLAICTGVGILIAGVLFVFLSSIHLDTKVIRAKPITKTRVVSGPSVVTVKYVEIPAAPAPKVVISDAPLASCPAALEAADEIINSINLGQDPSSWIAEYNKQRAKC
jgi:hypothetical protein